jgi:IS5 family transposase
MKSLTDFALKEEYKRVESVGDKLSDIESFIDWKSFRSILG